MIKYKKNAYRKFDKPSISIGIIPYRINNNYIEFLMVQRRYSYSYIEFIRGKYNLNNIKRLNHLFKEMTPDEKCFIKNNNFTHIWNILWNYKKDKKYEKEFCISKNKFNALKKGVFINNKLITLHYIINNNKSNLLINDWGFPKGKKNIGETEISCAIREFKEETQIVLNGIPELSQTYKKDNGGTFYLYVFKGEKRFVPHLDFEHTDWGYFDIANLPEPLDDWVKETIEND